jgi:putative Holliday junction resolvase
MAILGVDYGERRTGLAMSDVSNSFAYIYHPITTHKNDHDLARKISELVKNENIAKLVIGVPYGFEGKETTITKKVKSFIQFLKTLIDAEIIEWDETGTSNFAISNLGILAKKRSVDSESARIMLQEYLDHTKHLNK